VKYGDGGVDIEPLAHLYKTQVFNLARYLSLPREVIERTPSPDTYSFPVSDQDIYFCMPYEILDYIIYAHEHDIPKNEVAHALNLATEQIERAIRDIAHKRDTTKTMRELPPSTKF
jgi:NAD+ synthase